MKLTLRPATTDDAENCGRICYAAFKAIAEQHNFPTDIPSPEIAIERLARQLAHPGYYAVVAELDGRVVGSNFLDERSTVAFIGPTTVDPAVQNRTIGRQLMQNTLDRAAERHFPGVRLVQVAYHNRSLCLYAKLGFQAREILSTIQGPPLAVQIPGYAVRPATKDDLDACNDVSLRVHGYDRAGDLLDAVKRGTATVVEHGDRISGYATSIGFFGHAVGETNEDLKALLGAAPEFPLPGFLLPTRNAELFRWCLEYDLRVVHQTILMSRGLYNEPSGVYLPSVQ